MEIISVLLAFLVLALAYLAYSLKSNSNKIETGDLVHFSESLINQIQKVRKEIDKN